MSDFQSRGMSRRRFLVGHAASALSLATGMVLPVGCAWAGARTIHKAGDLEALVVSDGSFTFPADFLVDPEAPPADREAVLQGPGQGGEQLRLTNNVTVIRRQRDLILVDAGAGPRHQPTAGKLAENLIAAGIRPADITTVVLTHGHPDHLWGVLDAGDNPIYPNANYVISGRELDLWADLNVLQTLPPALPKERVVNGARNHLARINDRVRTVRDGDEIVSGLRVIETPGHTPGHIALELAGGDGLVVAGDAITHALISFQHPSWRVPVDHEADRGIATRSRLLDQLAADKRRLVAAHLPFPGAGFVERKDGGYRFVPA
jgi:glyoxylase-like metal-dependent hydrolase (beta-lactamase superfamily II)